MKSSAVLGIGYADASEILEVQVAGGRTYRYFDVPWDVHEEFMSAQSKGHYYNTRIKPCYEYAEVVSRARSPGGRAARPSR